MGYEKFFLLSFTFFPILISCGGGYKEEKEFKYCVSICKDLKSTCYYPDSFKLTSDCEYGTGKDNPNTKFVYIPFSAKNLLGYQVSDIGFYSNDVFRGTYNNLNTYDIVTRAIILNMIDVHNNKLYEKAYSADQINGELK